MKILHIGDFHLDSAFSGFDKEKADEKRAQLRECFTRALEIARERGVGLVLIAGDLFDSPFCTSNTRKTVFEAIEKVGCPVVIAPGNHDYYNKNGTYADKSLPENAYVFTSGELGRFDFDELGVSILGYAFTSDRYEENPLSGEIPLSEQNVNILCAHTELGAPYSKYAPISAGVISRAGFAYAALGHVHIAPPPMRIGASLVAYCGFPQGRSFDELGKGGAYIVDLDIETKSVDLERITLSRLEYRTEKLDITACERDSDVIDKINGLIAEKNYGENTALRVILLGAVPSSYSISETRLEASPEFKNLALLQIKNESTANFDLAYLKDDMTVRGEVYRKLLPLLESDDENERARASLALTFALSALDKREII